MEVSDMHSTDVGVRRSMVAGPCAFRYLVRDNRSGYKEGRMTAACRVVAASAVASCGIDPNRRI